MSSTPESASVASPASAVSSASAGKRVFIGGIFHETHTMLEGATGLADCQIALGDEIFAQRGDASPTAGALEVADAAGWQLLPSIDLRAMPGPMVEDAVVDYWWEHFEPALNNAVEQGIDAVYLVLHGAMVSQSLPDVEGEILRRVRERIGPELPIAGVTDLHANFTPVMAANSNGLVTYRTNPHIDAKESANRGARLLDELLTSGRKATTYFQQAPIAWPPTGTGTADEPMKGLEALARKIEAADAEILAVNVHAGYSFADIPETGVSFSVISTGDEAKAREALKRLNDLALATKEAGNAVDMPLDEALVQVKALLQEGTGKGPLILVEPSDNIGGGAPGDAATILRTLVRERISNSAVIIDDAAAVQRVYALADGERVTLSLGGKGSILNGGPYELEVERVSVSDGRFELEDKQSHLASMYGLHIDMGPCAVVRHVFEAGTDEFVTILLTSEQTPPFDLGQLRSQGIIPEELDVIGVKAAVAHRRAYDPITRASFTVETPGPCASNLRILPFKNIRRPIFPLDAID